MVYIVHAKLCVALASFNLRDATSGCAGLYVGTHGYDVIVVHFRKNA